MPSRSVCLVTLSPSEAGPGRFGRQVSVTDIYLAMPCHAMPCTGSSLTTPFTEGCPGVNNKASPPGRHQEQAPKQRCTFSPTTFSSVQFSTRDCAFESATAGLRS